MERLMSAIEQVGHLPFPKEDAERIISLGERIIQESTDTHLRELAISSICMAYKRIGDEENAIRYANMGGDIYSSRESILANVRSGEDGVRACQKSILSALYLAASDASIMLSKAKFSPEEEIAVYQFSIGLLELLFSDGNTGPYAHDLSNYYAGLAIRYAGTGDTDKTIEALEQCAKYAVSTVDLGKMQYTAPMVNRLGYDSTQFVKNYKGNACDLHLRKMLVPERSEFDFIRNDERFRQIVEKLKRHAEFPDDCTSQSGKTLISYGFPIS